ncbi:MAG: hypothetical protein RMY34_29030 [Aulosira sp. DedQUE10]|nr:hypothetical protein [Aulosira sp. DedQUE10]
METCIMKIVEKKCFADLVQLGGNKAIAFPSLVKYKIIGVYRRLSSSIGG